MFGCLLRRIADGNAGTRAQPDSGIRTPSAIQADVLVYERKPYLPWLPTPGPGRGVAAQDVPACMGAENLDQPVRFTWAGIEEFTRDAPPENWTYYRCAQTPAAAAGFYREQLVTSPFNWQERHWFERPEGTQGVYFHQASERWVFIWFLPDPSAEQSSLLVVAWAEAHTC